MILGSVGLGGPWGQAEGSRPIKHLCTLQKEGESKSSVSIFLFALVDLLDCPH